MCLSTYRKNVKSFKRAVQTFHHLNLQKYLLTKFWTAILEGFALPSVLVIISWPFWSIPSPTGLRCHSSLISVTGFILLHSVHCCRVWHSHSAPDIRICWCPNVGMMTPAIWQCDGYIALDCNCYCDCASLYINLCIDLYMLREDSQYCFLFVGHVPVVNAITASTRWLPSYLGPISPCSTGRTPRWNVPLLLGGTAELVRNG